MRKLAVFCLFLALCGCASQNAQSPMAGRNLYYPACYRPLEQARQVDSTASEVAKGAGKGFLGGTLAGLAAGGVSALFTGNPMNIVSGAAMGAAGGTVAGGVYGGMDGNEARKQALVTMWSQEYGVSLQGLPFNGAAAVTSLQCYNSAYFDLQRKIDDGAISNYAAAPMLDEIAQGRREAQQLMDGAGN